MQENPVDLFDDMNLFCRVFSRAKVFEEPSTVNILTHGYNEYRTRFGCCLSENLLQPKYNSIWKVHAKVEDRINDNKSKSQMEFSLTQTRYNTSLWVHLIQVVSELRLNKIVQYNYQENINRLLCHSAG